MPSRLEKLFLAVAARPKRRHDPAPLLVELLGRTQEGEKIDHESFPFAYRLQKAKASCLYSIDCNLSFDLILGLRRVVEDVSSSLDPESVYPLSFGRLVQILSQNAAEGLSAIAGEGTIRALAELVTYEALGLSRILALAKDGKVTEFYVDSDVSPVYLDHSEGGRCETTLMLTERERGALQTHADTFSGYSLDYQTPSIKNDLELSGVKLRISLDLDPVSVNRFSLDVRKLNVSGLSMKDLIRLNVITGEAASLLIGWLESGGNLTIIGETGTGKTTILNALDEQVEPRLRRVYIEDAVETRDMLDKGYHQMKLKVDPFDRSTLNERTKESEIVKVLHRSPDIVILSEVQSEEHSRAFFHSLSAGAKGIQTFHASSIEQAIRRWVNVHHIAEESLLDLGLLVQMARPDRLGPGRFVQRISEVVAQSSSPRVRDLFLRDRGFNLRRVAETGYPAPPFGCAPDEFSRSIVRAASRLSSGSTL
ncbi:MAG: type II/IV secretion system ATPase subunit [Thaumarchaeota archaeon]|nr:type II/IV secretion system ATPase subunit [Nitrososphaerota archaeon]